MSSWVARRPFRAAFRCPESASAAFGASFLLAGRAPWYHLVPKSRLGHLDRPPLARFMGYTRRQLCYIVAKSLTGSGTKGYDNALRSFFDMEGTLESCINIGAAYIPTHAQHIYTHLPIQNICNLIEPLNA